MLQEALRVGEVPQYIKSNAFLSENARQLARLHAFQLKEIRAGGRDFVFVSGSGNIGLANTVAQLLEEKLYYAVHRFDGGEVVGHMPPQTSNKQVIIFQSMGPPVNDNLMELLVMEDAVKRTGSDITVVTPLMGYMRQDKKDLSGRSITARLVADLIETAGAKRVMVCDMHAEQEQGFFNIPVDNLYASYVLIPYVREVIDSKGLNIKVAAPDGGSVPRALSWSRRINHHENIVTFQKTRDRHTQKTKIVGCQGRIKDVDILLTDDMYASGKTLEDCATYAKKHGAKSVRAVVVHGFFNGRDKRSALELLNESPLDEIIVTDTVDIPEEIRNHPKVTVVSVAPLLAEAIYRNLVGIPLSDMVV